MVFTGFYEKTKKPTDDELAEALGPAISLWHELRRLIAQQFAPLTEEWVFSGKSYGWSLRLKQKKKLRNQSRNLSNQHWLNQNKKQNNSFLYRIAWFISGLEVS